jgi:hypothetical protein
MITTPPVTVGFNWSDVWLPLSFILAFISAAGAMLVRSFDSRVRAAVQPIANSLGELTRAVADNTRAAQETKIEIVKLQTELVEVETQLRDRQQYDALRTASDERIVKMIYRQVFEHDLPDLTFPPIAPVPVRRV